jgi:hypothetical protein
MDPKFIVVASRKGREEPITSFDGEDTFPGFDPRVIWYDYTGTRSDSPQADLWSHASSGGGASQAFCTPRLLSIDGWDYAGGIPHDVWVRPADLREMARLAARLGLVAWAPSLTLDSECTYPHQRVQAGRVWHEVPFVEDQCMFVDRRMLEELLPWHEACPTGCGVTHHAMPFLLSCRPGARCGVFDFASCWHSEPSRTMGREDWHRDVERARTLTLERAMAWASDRGRGEETMQARLERAIAERMAKEGRS